MPHLNVFTKKYQQQKTIRFELRGDKKTIENVKKHGLLEEDAQRAEDYKAVKAIIDRYHREFITESLSSISGAKRDEIVEELHKFETLYFRNSKSDTEKKELDKIRTTLRKQIVASFKGNAKYKDLFVEKLIKQVLPAWLTDEDEKKLVGNFNNFTTYFEGFHKNRRNIYTDKEQSTAVGYRLIHDNLPKFLENVRVFRKLEKEFNDLDLSKVATDLKEEFRGKSIEEIFTIEHFCNTFTQEGIDDYNTILGGKTKSGVTDKKQGINELINEYRQPKDLKPKQLPNMKGLFKQILSERESHSFIPEKFESDKELLEGIKKFYHEMTHWEHHGNENLNVFSELRKALGNLSKEELSEVYYKGDKIDGLSRVMYKQEDVINKALDTYYEEYLFPLKGKKRSDTYEKNKDKWLKSKYFTLQMLQDALNHYFKEVDDVESKRIEKYLQSLATYIIPKGKNQSEMISMLKQIDEYYNEVAPILELEELDKNSDKKKKQVAIIKEFVTSINTLIHFIKPLYVRNGYDKDAGFYGEFDPIYEQINTISRLYEKVQYYLTKKPYSIEKIKLTFWKGTLLKGFVESNGKTQYFGYLFRKRNQIDEYDYYLGISTDTKLFSSNTHVKENDKSDFERLDYYQMKANSIYGSSYKGYYGNNYGDDKVELVKVIKDFLNKSHEDLLNEIQKKITGNTKETPNFYLKSIRDLSPRVFDELLQNDVFSKAQDKLMDKIKTLLKERYLHKVPMVNDILSKKYSTLNELMDDISEMAKTKHFKYSPVSNGEFETVCDRDKNPLFLFKISNKDLSFAETHTTKINGKEKRKKENRGKDNLHTMYFKELMSANQTVYDLGSGEVFFRQKSINYSKEKWEKGHHYGKPKMKDFDYPIIKNKRFAEDKYGLHLSMKLNYKKNKDYNINSDVLSFLKNNPDVNIIGIDRGERNLLYFTLIDQQGNIKEQFSLNKTEYFHNGEKHEKDYHKKLSKKEKKRKKARKNWNVIGNIKDLKAGYLSQVIHMITNKMVEHNAIVVLEDLNFGFKNSRQKVEKQVYQKFEKMLIDKLNYLVFKDKDANEPGGVLNALQLTSQFTSFKDMGKQSGFLFYMPATHTSKIDPVTGFVNFLYPKYESVAKSKEYFGQFDSIRFNPNKEWFEFDFDYSKFRNSRCPEGTRTKWTVVTTPKTRYRWNKTKKTYESVNVTQQLKKLFDDYKIPYSHGNNLLDEIISQDSKESKNFFARLMGLLDTTVSLRYNNGIKKNKKDVKENDEKIEKKELDYILSPVADDKGEFFNSLEAGADLPKDSDANGAYHIALKGLWALHQINQYDEESDEKGKNPKLAMSNKDWLKFVQEKPYKKN